MQFLGDHSSHCYVKEDSWECGNPFCAQVSDREISYSWVIYNLARREVGSENEKYRVKMHHVYTTT